ncbi:Glycosyl hydrolases family 11 [Reichenbachiella agariperforans]|uniref:Endo-1,4-beta-xylanase n=2 Tax=Reichenbachiella agariperforans TaxID=156994 RepID=A0A1M6V3Q7_REIAG|nr:Glycosyl hydrolases family 11 [Reichenbachiella agariperforans]
MGIVFNIFNPNSATELRFIMEKASFYRVEKVICLSLIGVLLSIQNLHSQTFCIESGSDQVAGVQDDYRYELWNQNSEGTACMTLGSGALFSGEWDDILNYLARRGLDYDQTQEHEEIGRFYATYDCDYNPESATGNSYLSIYGWTVDPLIEFYIVEDWRNWIPSMANGVSSKGSISVNGATYDIYENTRVNQPSILGNTTFQQYFSIRRDERNAGTINISEHFDRWESLGMDLGKLYEVSFVVEGYKSTGSFEFTALDVFVNKDEPILGSDTNAVTSWLDVYPNPSSGKVSINIDPSVSNPAINIYDNTGKLVLSQKNIRDHQVQLSKLVSGIYIINIHSSGRSYTTKLLVN